MLDSEAAAPQMADSALHDHLVAEGARDQKAGAQVDHRAADRAEMGEQGAFLHAERRGEEGPGAGVEDGEITREEYDSRRVAVAPFDGDVAPMRKHWICLQFHPALPGMARCCPIAGAAAFMRYPESDSA